MTATLTRGRRSARAARRRAARDPVHAGARPSFRPRRRSARQQLVPVVVGRDRREAPAADPGDARALGLDPPPGLRVVERRDAAPLRPSRTWSASAPCPASGTMLAGSNRRPDLVRQPEPVETGRGEHDRVEPPLVALAQARVDVPAQRLDREASDRARGAAPSAAPRPCRSASRAEAPVAPQSASRASSRSR